MEAKCSGSKCFMQAGTINVEECEATEHCPNFTPKTTICAFCKILPATQEIHGNPCCGSCKMTLDLAEQFSKMQTEISSGFKRLEEILKKDKI